MSRRHTRGSDSKRFRDWLDRAHGDLLAAQMLVKDASCYYACAFHCQQCIEKAIKAFLLMETDVLFDGHNLTWLCKKACSFDHTFDEWLDESVILNSYYIATRYPTDIPFQIEERQVRSALQMASDMYHFIVDTMYDDLSFSPKSV